MTRCLPEPTVSLPAPGYERVLKRVSGITYDYQDVPS